MANFQVYNDKIWTLPIKCQNSSGVFVAFPSGSNLAAVSSNPASLGAVVTSTILGTNLVLTPKVQVSPGLTVTITGVALAPINFMVDIVADPNLLSIAVDTTPADGTTVSQNVPIAAGP